MALEKADREKLLELRSITAEAQRAAKDSCLQLLAIGDLVGADLVHQIWVDVIKFSEWIDGQLAAKQPHS